MNVLASCVRDDVREPRSDLAGHRSELLVADSRLRAFAFLFQVAAAHVRGLLPVRVGFRGPDEVLSQKREDVLLADGRGAIL